MPTYLWKVFYPWRVFPPVLRWEWRIWIGHGLRFYCTTPGRGTTTSSPCFRRPIPWDSPANTYPKKPQKIQKHTPNTPQTRFKHNSNTPQTRFNVKAKPKSFPLFSQKTFFFQKNDLILSFYHFSLSLAPAENVELFSTSPISSRVYEKLLMVHTYENLATLICRKNKKSTANWLINQSMVSRKRNKKVMLLID